MINSLIANLRPFKLVLLTLLISTPLISYAENKELNGQAFQVKMLAKGSDKPIDNTLTFESDTFLSAVCVKHDFPQSKYRAYEKDGVTHFEVDAKSYTKGNMVWKGQVNSNGELQANAVWHKPDAEAPIEFQIKGNKKQ